LISAMDVDYELSQQLIGHDSPVRCVALIAEDTLATGGLDAQVLVWKRPTPNDKFAVVKTLAHHSDWVNDIAPAASGGFYTASKDRTACRLDAEWNLQMKFEGHTDNVCCLVECGAQLVTGSWDGTAKVWDANTGECRHTLEVGQYAVTVAVLPTGEIITGSSDAALRIYRGAECVNTIENAHGDMIRAISVGSTNFVTGSKDQSIKIWSFDGVEMAVLPGHQNFIYGVSMTPDNQAVWSCGEDSCAKKWSLENSSCTQTIAHAGSVWQALPLANGDVVTACNDKIVRIWTADPERFAPEEERKVNQELVQEAQLYAAQKGSSSTTMPDAADISTMPGTVGKKNGEIKCFKEGNIVWAFSWNAGARIWDKIGEVTGGAEQKKHYPGDFIFKAGEYDFIWDVELGADRKALLPYNRGENPMSVAEAFCARESIRKDNLDQIRKFIEQNSGGGAMQTGSTAAPAPAAPKAAPKELSSSSSMFPLASPLQFKDVKYEPLHKKILEFNAQVDDSLKMTELELQFFNSAVEKLQTQGQRAEFKQVEVEVIHSKLIQWPQQYLFPVMDLWRMFLLHGQSCDFYKGSDRGAPVISKVCGFLAAGAPDPLVMCSLRYIANLSSYNTNRTAAFYFWETILKAVGPCFVQSTNKHIKLAGITIVLNFAICAHEMSYPPKPWNAECGMELAKLAFNFLEKSGAEDGDAQQRAALAIGTLLPRDKENGSAIATACKEAQFLQKLAPIEDKVTPKVVAELKKLLS